MALLILNTYAQAGNQIQKNFVFDYEKDFTASQIDSVQELLQNHYNKTGDEIIVVTSGSVGDDILQYAAQFGNEHSFINQNQGNGMVIVFSLMDRQFGETNKTLKLYSPSRTPIN